MARVSYEDPLEHLLASFNEDQAKLWRQHLAGEKVRCVTVGSDSLLSAREIAKEAVKIFKGKAA